MLFPNKNKTKKYKSLTGISVGNKQKRKYYKNKTINSKIDHQWKEITVDNPDSIIIDQQKRIKISYLINKAEKKRKIKLKNNKYKN